MAIPSIPEVWGLENYTGFGRGFLDFLSRMYVINGILTLNFELTADALKHLILPMIALGTIPLAIIARMTRSSMLEVMSLDYMRTARAKGLGERRVVFRHAMRNALLPIVTIIGLQLGALLSGAILTETIFGLTGVGKTLYDAINSRDYVVVQAFTLVIAVVFVMANLIVDVSYAVLDPRIRLS
jgi:peptide/nickel transport system permease protein